MDAGLGIIFGSILFFVLVFIGIRPIISTVFEKEITMKVPDEFRNWLVEKTQSSENYVYFISEGCPPNVYDEVADVIKKKPKLHVRILTQPTVLSSHVKDGNKMVDLAFNKKYPNIELRISRTLPKHHIKIFDGKSAWFEDTHPIGDFEQGFRRGVSTSDLTKVSMYQKEFELHWKQSERKKPEKIFDISISEMKEESVD